jgi:hypothetical protein
VRVLQKTRAILIVLIISTHERAFHQVPLQELEFILIAITVSIDKQVLQPSSNVFASK